MSSDDEMQKVKDGVEIIGQIIKSAGDNEEVKVAGKELGKTAVTITTAVNNILLPLAAINFSFEKARKYFNEKFPEDLSETTNKIDEKDIIEPKASIAGPAIQALAFTFEDADLKEMYLNLLATSMDRNNSESAHPAFIEIIRQLNTAEAELLKDIFSAKSPNLPVVQLRDAESHNKYVIVQNYVLNVRDDETGEPYCDPNVSKMIENLIRLGLIKVEFGIQVDWPNAYDWAQSRPEIELIAQNNPHKKVNIQIIKGVLSITGLGWDFSQAVGLYDYYT